MRFTSRLRSGPSANDPAPEAPLAWPIWQRVWRTPKPSQSCGPSAPASELPGLRELRPQVGAHAFGCLRHLGRDHADRLGSGELHQRLNVGVSAEPAQMVGGSEHSLIIGLERATRWEPHAFAGFNRVVQGGLAPWELGDEEPRIEPDCQSTWCDP